MCFLRIVCLFLCAYVWRRAETKPFDQFRPSSYYSSFIRKVSEVTSMRSTNHGRKETCGRGGKLLPLWTMQQFPTLENLPNYLTISTKLRRTAAFKESQTNSLVPKGPTKSQKYNPTATAYGSFGVTI